MISEFYNKEVSQNQIEFSKHMIERMVMRDLEKNDSVVCEESREFYTAKHEECYGSNVAQRYFESITSLTTSAISRGSAILKAVEVEDTDVFDNVAELLAFSRFMNRHNLPMLRTQASNLISSKGHVQLYEKMAGWCREINRKIEIEH